MPKPVTAVLAVLLAIAAFALGHWTASRPPHRAAGATVGGDAARRAIEELIRGPGSVENLEQLAHLLNQLGPDAVPAIAPTILNPAESLDAPRALALLQFWIDRDPAGAAEWTAKMAPLGYRSLVLGLAVEKIAESDPRSALKFVGRGRGVDSQLL